MTLLQEHDRIEVAKLFADLEGETTLRFFGDADGDCPLCPETVAFAAELADLSDRIELETHDLALDFALARASGVERAPALALLGPGGWDPGLRFFGIPAGYEAATIVHDLLLLSRRDSGLTDRSRAALAGLEHDVEIKVFVTPTCPYCPRAALTAHQLALESDRIRASVYEANEFPDLIDRYQVMGVPKIVVGETSEFEGARPEHDFVDRVLAAAATST